MSTKTVYQLDYQGVFVGETEAFESPLEPGVFPLPAGCVSITPPSRDGMIAVWRNNAWELEKDCRGEIWYRETIPVTIDFVGDPAKSGFTATPPEPASPLLLDLTARQLRLGLLEIGIKPTDVTAAIEQLSDADREKAVIEWEYANTFQRRHPLIAMLAAHFHLTDEAVDDAWRFSMTL